MTAKGLKNCLKNRVPGLMDARRSYAVLVPLVEINGNYHLLYEVRALTMKRQPGEVCFPGGRMEAGESAEECALRETWEELAIPAERIRILGRLDFIAHRACFLMQPVLAVVDSGAVERMVLNPDEVDQTFLVPLSHLMDTPPREYEYRLDPHTEEGFPFGLLGIPEDYPWQPGRENVPVWLWKGRAIWGLTARITRHLVKLLKENG